MHRIISAILAIHLCWPFLIQPADAAEKLPATPPEANRVLKIGMLSGMFRDVPRVQIQAAMGPFKRMFKEMIGEEADVIIYPDHNTLAERLSTGECSIGIFHGFEYAWIKPRYPTIEPFVVTVPHARKIQACLVVNKDSEIEKPADLDGRCVVMPKSSKAHCLLFLERLQESLPPDTCCPLHRNTLTPEDVLDGIINGDYRATVVDTSSLSIYKNLKPGAYEQLRILQASEQFPAAVIVTQKGAVDERVLEKLRKTLLAANANAQGRLMLTLWSLKGVELPPPDYLEQLETIAKVYPEKSKQAASETPTRKP